MQCRYKEKLIFAGDMIFGVIYPTFRRGGARRGKFRESSETQKRLNERKSTQRLVWLIHANFGKNDYALHLTYKDGFLPESEEQFLKDIKNYIRRVGRIYAKNGLDFKYVYVWEYSETGRPHVHLVVSGGISRDLLEDAWGMGRCNADRLQFNECGIVDLAKYITKADRTKHARRYVCSRNLAKPAEKTNVHTWSRKQISEVDSVGNPHKRFADLYPGYWLSEFPRVEQNGVNGGMYMEFVMYKPDGDNLAAYRKRKKSEKWEKV
jgi:hypothetical protein